MQGNRRSRRHSSFCESAKGEKLGYPRAGNMGDRKHLLGLYYVSRHGYQRRRSGQFDRSTQYRQKIDSDKTLLLGAFKFMQRIAFTKDRTGCLGHPSAV
jgi:hypothetical protein